MSSRVDFVLSLDNLCLANCTLDNSVSKCETLSRRLQLAYAPLGNDTPSSTRRAKLTYSSCSWAGFISLRFLLSAILEDSQEVLAKLVEDRCGECVRRLLVAKELAPQLLAHSKPGHLPGAYTMEYLQGQLVYSRQRPLRQVE